MMMDKCSRKLMVSEDRLSSLPESVLVHILSFLPPQDAVRTVFLRRSYRDLWKITDTLNFVDTFFLEEDEDGLYEPEPMEMLQFIRFVRYFLMLHKRPRIRKFSVRFSFTLGTLSTMFANEYSELVEWKLVSEVEMWLLFALGKEVEVLDLDIGLDEDEPLGKNFSLPHFIWVSHSLVELRLCNCDIGYPKRFQIGLLRVLELNRVGLSNEVFGKIIASCPLLQELKVADCTELSEVSFTAPKIGTLQVKKEILDRKLLVNCPNVRSFDFSGFVGFVELVNLSSLKVAAFNLRIRYGKDFHEFFLFKRFLEKIQHAEVLKLNNEAFAVLTYRVVKNHPCPRNKWKRVVLNTCLNRKYVSGLWSLLRYSIYLEELIINIEGDTINFPEAMELELDDSTHLGPSNWSSECLIPSLKNVTMNGVLKSSSVAQVDLVKAILKNAVALDTFYFLTNGNAQHVGTDALTPEELFEISKKLLTFPRASKQAVVYSM